MKKETLARILVAVLILVAAAIPFVGGWFKTGRENVVELHGRMPENGGWSIETIDAKVGQPLHLRITSDDVMHGFAIGRSDDAPIEILPGEMVEKTLVFDRPGKYTFYCTVWCGANHWRMRGTIVVTGPGEPLPPDPQPAFLKYGIDIDAPQVADTLPPPAVSAGLGEKLSGRLPGYAIDPETYLTNSPALLFLRLRADVSLSDLTDMDIWDAVAWIWQSQTTPAGLAAGQKLYAQNCAACHGEQGQGDGVMVRGLPTWQPGRPSSANTPGVQSPQGQVSPRDFSDPRVLLGESPALLEGKIIRGGNGTGMPYWGPIFTHDQLQELVSYLYSFAWEARARR